MTTAHASLTQPRDLERWERTFERLPEAMTAAAYVKMQVATEAFYDASQDVVHVVTGYLKSTGHWDVVVNGYEVEGTVEYDAEYAVYENDRGGDHAFMEIAWERTAGEFDHLGDDLWERVF